MKLKSSRSTVGRGMNLGTRYHTNKKIKGSYNRKKFKQGVEQ